jgi:DNA mismatch repair protein MutL
LLRVPLRLVGVVGRLYVVFESDRGLVLMDQHAAHERVLFEEMLKRLESGVVPAQRLLLPATIELSVRDAQFLREHLSLLTRLGVGLGEFGERTFLLDALPPMVKSPEPRRFVLELIDELKAAGQQLNSQRLGEQTIAKTVCRHAVKANDPLTGPELENLVNDLRHCEMPYTCPHGRPTLIEMSYRELEKNSAGWPDLVMEGCVLALPDAVRHRQGFPHAFPSDKDPAGTSSSLACSWRKFSTFSWMIC